MKKNKDSFTINLRVVTIIMTVILSFLLILAIILKYSIKLDDDNKWLGPLFETIIIIVPILISICGVSLYLQITSFSNAIKEAINSQSDDHFKGGPAKRYILNNCSSKEILGLLYLSFDNKNYSANDEIDTKTIEMPHFHNCIKSLLKSPYILEDKYDMFLDICDKMIKKKNVRKFTLNKNKTNIDSYTFSVDYLGMEGAVLADVKVNGKALTEEELKNEDLPSDIQDANPESTTYTKVKFFKIPLLGNGDENGNYNIEYTLSYAVPITDKVGFSIEKYPTKKLNHYISVKSNNTKERICLDLSTFAMMPSVDETKKNDYRIIKVPRDEDNANNTVAVNVLFNSWSFPGDGYGYLIRYKEK